MDPIIKCIDDFLTRTGQPYTDPVEAMQVLAKAGILRDSKARPGKPLRDLLRKGRLPHAYQNGGKGSSWIIPHSGSNDKKSEKEISFSEHKTPLKSGVNGKEIDIHELKKQLEKSRLRYKPEKIKYLLIAEAPPETIERFFYYTDVREHDYLFLGVTEAIYPELKRKFLDSRRDSGIKQLILTKFQMGGFYLLDLSELPLSFLQNSLSSQLPKLVGKIKSEINTETSIILIKANVYDLVYMQLKDQFNIINKRIPFPGQGVQKKFQEEFKKALNIAGYKTVND